jgi:flagellar biosynthetic protein FlhB
MERGKTLMTSSARFITFPEPLTPEYVQNLLWNAIGTLAPLALFLMAIVLTTAICLHAFQSGFMITPKAFGKGAEKLNPVTNVQQFFSLQPIQDFAQSLLELTAIVAVGWAMAATIESVVLQSVGMPSGAILEKIWSLVVGFGLRAGGVLLVAAAIDYGWQRYQHEKSLRMTKEEIKREFKDQEGDPYVKNQRRRAARALIQKNSLKMVRTAEVVITNPTHFAVALRYDRTRDSAPIVVGKGADLVAKRIRDIAVRHGAEIVQNPPLARGLYRAVEVGQTIPPEFYRAVAEVLAYVYSRRGKSL